MLDLEDDDNAKFIQIYLFDPMGKFYWCNGSADVDIENQGVLHAGLFATLHNFSLETLGEKLNYLLINELRINMFSLIDEFLVAIVTPKFLKVDPRQIEVIKTKIKRELSENVQNSSDDMTDLITKNLNKLLQDLLDWLDTYASQADRAMNVFTSEIANIEDKEVGVFLYTWDWNRVFKYVPSSNIIDFQIEELVDSTINNMELMSNLDRTFLIQNGTIVYFFVNELILVLTKSYQQGELEACMKQIVDSSNYYEDIIRQILNKEAEEVV